MRLSFVRLTLFLARLMARPRVTLLTSDTLWMVSSNVNRPTRLWVAFGKNYARKPRQPYFVWCLRVFFLMAFHTLSLLHFPPLRYAPAFSTPAFSAPPPRNLLVTSPIPTGPLHPVQSRPIAWRRSLFFRTRCRGLLPVPIFTHPDF